MATKTCMAVKMIAHECEHGCKEGNILRKISLVIAVNGESPAGKTVYDIESI